MKQTVLLMASIYGPMQTLLEAHYTVVPYEPTMPKAELAELAAECEIVVTTGGRGIEAAVMQQLPKLKMVGCFGVGVDAIDLAYCKANHILVSNTPDVLTEEVADLALALLLSSIRRIPQGDQFVRHGQWLKGGMPLTLSLQNMKVGIVGMGRIGQAIAKRALSFNTTIGYQGPRAKADLSFQYFSTVEALGEWADVIIAACPGGAATQKVISRAALKALGPQGTFINIARGSVVDQEALIELLASGELGAAGLDVFNNEPKVPETLWTMPNVVLMPHVGSGTHATRAAMGQLTLDNVAAFVSGKPLLTAV
jgi:lactate dehydrogenase-like 2-hydroxyacid dehydrogenase